MVDIQNRLPRQVWWLLLVYKSAPVPVQAGAGPQVSYSYGNISGAGTHRRSATSSHCFFLLYRSSVLYLEFKREQDVEKVTCGRGGGRVPSVITSNKHRTYRLNSIGEGGRKSGEKIHTHPVFINHRLCVLLLQRRTC